MMEAWPPSSEARSRRPISPYELGLRGVLLENPEPSSRILSASSEPVRSIATSHARGRRMLGDVGERFLNDPEYRRGVGVRQLELMTVHRQLAGNPAALGEGLRQPFDRRNKTQVIEHQRAQVGRDATSRRDRLFQQRLPSWQAGLSLPGGYPGRVP